MTKRSDTIALGAFLMATGHHVAAWRHPEAQADGGFNLDHYIAVAKQAEAAGFDTIFLADTQGGHVDRNDQVALSTQPHVATFEPLTLLSAIAAHTSRIGLIATATTTYYEPYILARLFGSLDVLSGGRAGWNVVTSASAPEAANFSRAAHPEPEDRYARAEEFVDVVKGLWSTWEDDAFPVDKERGIFADTSKLHILNHVGTHFQVAGPLSVPRSPQGHPVIVQAGSSNAGKALAARTAEVVFTAHQRIEAAQEFYADVKGQMARHGRSRSSMKIMPGIFPVVGGTEAEALAKLEELHALIHPDIPRSFLAQIFQQPELLEIDIDRPLPNSLHVDASRASRPALLLDLARREKLTARQLHRRVATARGHMNVHGTPEQIADLLEAWFDGRGADGFNIMPPYLPGGLTDFADQVVPVLRKRGRLREHDGRTLRENLGLPFPHHRASAAVAAE